MIAPGAIKHAARKTTVVLIGIPIGWVLANLVLPGVAWADMGSDFLPSLEQLVVVVLIVPVMVLTTFFSGAYSLLKTYHGETRWRTTARWVTHTVAWVLVLVLSTQLVWLAFLVFGGFAYTRAGQLIGLSKTLSLASPSDASKARQVFQLATAGWVLVLLTTGLLAAGFYFHPPPRLSGKQLAFRSKVINHLHNFHLACRAFWQTQGSDQECDLNIAMQKDYGLFVEKEVLLGGGGTETRFFARGTHLRIEETWIMDNEGNMKKKD